MDKIRLGMVGLGHRGRCLFRLAAGFPVCVPTAACDINPELWFESQRREKPLAEEFPQVRFFADFDAMLAAGACDALMVETPMSIHARFCAAALERHWHVLSDVPPVASRAEAAMLYEAANRSRGIFMIGANPNEWGFVEALVDLCRKNLLGDVIYAEAEYIHDCRCLWEETPWRREHSVPIRYCTHSLGPLLRVIPEDLRTVSCFSTGARIVGEPDQHDVMTAHFATAGQVVVRLTESFINAARCGLHSYRVFGTAGYFERLSERGKYPARTMFNSTALYGASGGLAELPVDTLRPEYQNATAPGAAGHGGADYAMLDRFLGAIAADDRSRVFGIRDALRMTLPGIAAEESARHGGAVTEIVYPWD